MNKAALPALLAAASGSLVGLSCEPARLTAFVETGAAVQSEGGAAGAGNPGNAGEPGQGCDPCDDFPELPILDQDHGTGVPENVGDLFDASGSSGVGPCLVEPELGSLFPRNWMRLRLRWLPAAGQTLFELRISADVEQHALVVYTSATDWTFPASLWQAVGQNVVDQPITISLRGLDPNASLPLPSLATIGTVSIAPVEARGSVTYFTSTGSPALKSFAVGDETVRDVLRPEGTTGRCVACHAPTPDDAFVAASVSSHDANGDLSHIELHPSDGTDLAPSFLSPDAQTLLAREQQHFPSFAAAHFQDGDRVLVDVMNGQLTWTDLEAASQLQDSAWGIFERAGDPNATITHPTFNHAGSAIAYSSIGLPSTVAIADQTDIYVVPYNDRRGGQALPLEGAASAEANEYYPAYSADDALLVFNRSTPPRDPGEPPFPPASVTSTYANPQSELWVVSSSGGVPRRLLANDPPACLGKPSPGVTNSWASWSRDVQTASGKTYYFLAFSSTRVDPLQGQLYATAVVIDAAGQIATYPALYFWNQPELESNHQPVWRSATP